jgi:hypothetical protein
MNMNEFFEKSIDTIEIPDIVKTLAWGMTWFKNNTEKGGAMKAAISALKTDELVAHSHTKKNGRLWGCISPEKLVNLIIKNHGIYEVITHFPHKLYFDIDGKADCTNTFEKFTDFHMEMINKYFPDGDAAISGSQTEEKWSLHITLNNYVIHNADERDAVKTLVRDVLKGEFDWKVYTKNRNMKAINQSKDDGRVQQIISNLNMKAHLITCFINPYPHKIEANFTAEVAEAISISKSKGKFDLSSLPKLSIKTPNELNFYKLKPFDILSLLPIDKSFDHNYTHRVARFCYSNELTFEQFLSWISKKHGNHNVSQKWLIHWNALHKFPPCTIESMKSILAYYYPSIKKDQFLNAFTNQFDVDTYVIKTYIDRLAPEHFEVEEKAILLNLTMGSGKTAQTIDYLGSPIGSLGGFCWIAHNIALVVGTLSRMRDSGVDCKSYQAFNAKAKTAGILNSQKNLAICAHSLHYISLEKSYGTLVIDEIESVVEAFIGSFMQKKVECFDVFKHLIKSAKKVILIDAFITMKTINLIRLIDPDCKMNFVLQSNIAPTKTLIFRNSTRESKDDAKIETEDTISNALHEICEFVRSKKRVFIFYPFKNGVEGRHFSMEEIMKLIKGKCDCRVVMYNSDVDDSVKDGLKNVNETWSNYDVVICNSVITCGVNFDLDGFDEVIMFLTSFITPRQSIQVSARIRKLKNNKISVYYIGAQCNTNCYIDDRKSVKCPIYSQLYKDSLIEDQSPRRKTFELFARKAPYKLVVNKLIIKNQITHDIKQLIDTDYEYNFEKIENIDSMTAAVYEEIVMEHNATMYMKFQLKKFYYIQQFSEKADLETIAEAWDNNLLSVVA